MDLRKKPRLDYKQMNDGEIADRKEIIKKRKVLPALYDVERIISVKNGSKEVRLCYYIYPIFIMYVNLLIDSHLDYVYIFFL